LRKFLLSATLPGVAVRLDPAIAAQANCVNGDYFHLRLHYDVRVLARGMAAFICGAVA
jgi:hypothetical protein